MKKQIIKIMPSVFWNCQRCNAKIPLGFDKKTKPFCNDCFKKLKKGGEK